MNETVFVNLYVHMGRQCVDDGRTNAMQTATGLVSLIVKLTACVKGGKNHTLRRYALFMHFNRNAAAAVLNRTGTVCLQGYPDGTAEPGQVLVHRIVYNLINQMV